MVLKQASRDAGSLLDMVDELLDFSLLESERLTLNWEQVDLGMLISEVLGVIQGTGNCQAGFSTVCPDGNTSRCQRGCSAHAAGAG